MVVDLPAEHKCMHGDQAKKDQLGAEKRVVVILLSFHPKHENAARGDEQEADAFGHAKLIDNIGNGILGHPPSKQPQIRHENHRRKGGNEG